MDLLIKKDDAQKIADFLVKHHEAINIMQILLNLKPVPAEAPAEEKCDKPE